MKTICGRQMTAYSKNGTSITNTYDANGIRGSKTVNGSKTTYHYLDGQLQYEKRGDGKELYYLYDSTGTLFMIRMCEDGDVEDYYVSTNWQGDVLALFTADKTKVAEYEYDVWGNATIYKTNESGSLVILDGTEEHIGNINPIRYRGYFYDSDMGLYYLQSRYYDAGIGRFINADSLISTGQDINGFNMFAYCGNNPVNRVDPTGTSWEGVWNFLKTAYDEIRNNMSGLSYAYAGCGGIAVSDGPLIIGDLIGLAGAGLLTLGAIGKGIYQAAKAPAVSETDEKENMVAATQSQTSRGKTYYHVTTIENAYSIIASGIMIGSPWEGQYVFAWERIPSKKAIKNSGVNIKLKKAVILSFETHYPFIKDIGISDPVASLYKPVRSFLPIPVIVSNVHIVR